MELKIISIVAILGTVIFVTTAVPRAHAQEVTSTATILGVCGLVTTPTTLVYGSLAPNAESAEQTLTLENVGNVDGAISVRGSDWSTLEFPDAMLVGATHYSLTAAQAYATKTALTSTDTAVTTLAPLATVNTYWQLKAVLNQPAGDGAATQTLTFTSSC